MRSVSSAIWTSGEPVSWSCVRNLLTISVFFSVSRGIGSLVASGGPRSAARCRGWSSGLRPAAHGAEGESVQGRTGPQVVKRRSIGARPRLVNHGGRDAGRAIALRTAPGG